MSYRKMKRTGIRGGVSPSNQVFSPDHTRCLNHISLLGESFSREQQLSLFFPSQRCCLWIAGVVRPLSCRPHYSCVLQTTLVGPALDNSTVFGAVPASGMAPEPSESLAAVLRRRPHTANGGAVDDEGGTSFCLFVCDVYPP